MNKTIQTEHNVEVPGSGAKEAPLLEVTNLKMHFPTRDGNLLQRRSSSIKAVDGLSFSVTRGETLGLVGESGCGKSTTGRAILQLHRPTSGSVKFNGTELTTIGRSQLREMRRSVQLIFQDPYASLNPRLPAGKIVSEPLTTHKVASGDALKERVAELFTLVGLSPSMINRYPHEFSGGQRQRIGIARALALNPDFIVADEPISALDVSIQAQVINLMEELQDRLNLTYLFIAHDLAVVRHISDRIAVMYLGKIVELADRNTLYKSPRHPYTQALISAIPVPDPKAERRRSEKRVILQGDVPSPSNPPTGCNFCTRCPARAVVKKQLGIDCGVVEPEYREVEPGHWSACHLDTLKAS